MTKIVIDGLEKRYSSHGRTVEVLTNVSLSVAPGEFVSIVGPSGCGKTTLLNIIAGLVPASAGTIKIDGQQQRGIPSNLGYITQQDNLLPWRSVLSNVEIALEIRGIQKAQRKKLAQELINKVGLRGFEDHYPHEISGGMRKRVALIRTLIYDPAILLMDEPFSALDSQTKIVLEDELLTLWEETRKTILFVTHDLGEAIILSDRIYLMTARPGTIKAVHEIKLPRPRKFVETQYSKEYVEIHKQLWSELEDEVKRSMLLESGGALREKGSIA